jgi:putative peptidoglycan lipid II flippase
MKFLRQSLFTASAITISASLLSRFFGYFREAVNANYFGTTINMDTFIIAFTVPEIIASVAYMSLPPALIPLLKKDEGGRAKNISVSFWSGLCLFLFIFLFLSILVYFLKSQLLWLFAPGKEMGSNVLGDRILSISAGYIFFRGVEVYFRSWLFAKKHFIMPAVSNFIMNIIILISVFALYDKIDIESLAYGWLFASIAIFILNGFVAFKIVHPGFISNISKKWMNIALRSVFAVATVESISLLFPVIDRLFASICLGVGEIAGLRYALIIFSMPMAIIAASYNIASFPWISEMVVQKNMENIIIFLRKSTNFLIYVMGYLAIFIYLYSEQIVFLAFQRGAFSGSSLTLTSSPLKFFAIGLLFQSLFIFFMRFYYARRKMYRLAGILIIILVLKTILSFLLVNSMGNGGLALATSVARIIGLIIIILDLGRELKLSITNIIFRSSVKISACLLPISLFLIIAKFLWLPTGNPDFIYNFINLGIVFGLGSLLYIGLGYLLKIEETIYIIDRVGTKILHIINRK